MEAKKKTESRNATKDNHILLLSEKSSYLINSNQKRINTSEGIIELDNIKTGTEIKSHKGVPFTVVKPNLNDYINHKLRRLPQAIIPKDSAIIMALTGINKNSVILEAGTGSAFSSVFFALHCKKIYSYEIRKDFFENAKKNIQILGIKNIILKNKDILDGIRERNIDMILLDMKNAEKAIPLAFNSLKTGGFLVVYSPYIEQVKASVEIIKTLRFTDIKTLENITRYWDVREHTLPKRKGMTHTGFITIARKF